MHYSIFDLLKLLGSLGFFLFGMKFMSESLQKVAGDKMRNILSAMTSNRYKGIFTGFFITAIIQSSSATTVMLVSFVNAGLISFTESIGVIMGSNIGTTVTAWLISILGFKIEISILVLPLIGLSLPLLFSKNQTRSNWGNVIIGFAIIFIGLDFLNHSTPDIKNNPAILGFLTKYSNYGYFSILIFLLISAFLTMIIQSSSAVMALTLVMCFNGWITFEMAAGMVLGQNIGTTITAILASLVANTSAKRTAIAHLFFNFIGVLLVLPFLYPFLHLIATIVIYNGFHSPFAIVEQTPQQTSEAIPIALSVFHSLFNILNTAVLIWFVKPLEKLILHIVKQKEDDEEFKLQFISTGILSTAELSILQARKELMVYTRRIEMMFFHTQELLKMSSTKEITHFQQKIKKSEEVSDQFEVEISAYLAEVSMQELSHQAAEIINEMLHITTNIESIADSCYSISNTINRKLSGNVRFNEAMHENLIRFSEGIAQLFCLMFGVMQDQQMRIDLHKVKALRLHITENHNKLQQEHFKNLRKCVYKTKVGVIYADIYNELKKVGDLVSQVINLLVSHEKIEVELKT